ncbi:type 4a pilus biogenesis protein PilO [Ningiella sp. W23]|uniref:type 4a pilus biogenesis protein PilO n=1 Tax=Ningiella sp. W23 TaxID=3023715 RepID=UPI003757E161
MMTQSKSTRPQQSSFKLAIEKFDALGNREKRLVFFALPCVMLFLMVMLVLEPLYVQIKREQAQIVSQQLQLLNLQETSAALIQSVHQDPDAATKGQIQAIENQLAHADSLFDDELGQLVSPKAMPMLLEQLFERAQGLELMQMESIAPTPVFEDQGQIEETALYRQGIRIRFQGDYFQTRDFFADAERLKWQLYWKSLRYSVDTHPLATTELEVFTLSTSEAFIGVN